MKFTWMLWFAVQSLTLMAQDSLTVKGVIKGLGDQKVVLSFTDPNGKNVFASATASEGRFSLSMAKQPQPVIARFSSPAQKSLSKTEAGKNYGNPAPQLFLFVYNADIQINGSIDNLHTATVKGGKENNEFASYKKAVEKIENRNWEISKLIFYIDRVKDSVELKKLMAESSGNFNRQKDIQKTFINDHPASFGALYLLSRMENLYTVSDYENAYEALGIDYKTTSLARQIEKRIAFLSPTAAGKPAIAFTRMDKDGNEIKLDNYKGRIVLLDFWGSWCGPCRASHPHLKELYSKYKSKGFEIIAIAQQRFKTLDERKEKWLEAIEKDGINWVHVMNDDGTEDRQNIVTDYRVTAFPTKILLDRDGKILLRITASATDDIDRMLEKMLGTN